MKQIILIIAIIVAYSTFIYAEEKEVIIAFDLKAKDHKALTITNYDFSFKTVDFVNPTDERKIICKPITIDNPTLAEYRLVYGVRPNISVYNTIFVLSPDHDTVFLKSNADDHGIHLERNEEFLIPSEYYDYEPELFTSRKPRVLNYEQLKAYKTKNLEKIESTPYSNGNIRNIMRDHFLLYYYDELFSVIRNDPTMSLNHSFVHQSIDEFLHLLDKGLISYNQRITGISSTISKLVAQNHRLKADKRCSNFEIFGVLAPVKHKDIVQGYLLKQILEAPVKSDSCWNNAVDMLKKSNFYTDHKADIDVIFKGYSTDGLSSILADVILSDINGKEYSLISLMKRQNGNKKTLVDLWATWCLPCLEENRALQVVMPHIQEDVVVIKISVDRKEQMTKWKEVAKSEKDSYIAKSGLQAFSKRFGIQSIPRYILFNEVGKIVDENFTRPSDVNFVNRIKDNNQENR